MSEYETDAKIWALWAEAVVVTTLMAGIAFIITMVLS